MFYLIWHIWEQVWSFSESWIDLIILKYLQDPHQGYTATLDSAAPYYDANVVQINDNGVIHYMCTRNNAFSNRDQKGSIVVVDFEFSYDTIGRNGGNIMFRFAGFFLLY